MYVFKRHGFHLQVCATRPPLLILQPFPQVIGKSRVEAIFGNFAFENINVEHGFGLPSRIRQRCCGKSKATGLPSRSSQRACDRVTKVRLGQGYGATAYALLYYASVDWR